LHQGTQGVEGRRWHMRRNQAKTGLNVALGDVSLYGFVAWAK
jgi:hypothetical protein